MISTHQAVIYSCSVIHVCPHPHQDQLLAHTLPIETSLVLVNRHACGHWHSYAGSMNSISSLHLYSILHIYCTPEFCKFLLIKSLLISDTPFLFLDQMHKDTKKKLMMMMMMMMMKCIRDRLHVDEDGPF